MTKAFQLINRKVMRDETKMDVRKCTTKLIKKMASSFASDPLHIFIPGRISVNMKLRGRDPSSDGYDDP